MMLLNIIILVILLGILCIAGVILYILSEVVLKVRNIDKICEKLSRYYE